MGGTVVDLEPHRSELHWPTYTWDSFNKYSTVLLYDFLNSAFSSLAYFIVRTQGIIHIPCKICVNRLYGIGKVSGQSRLLVVKFGGRQKLDVDFQLHRGRHSPPPWSSRVHFDTAPDRAGAGPGGRQLCGQTPGSLGSHAG